MGKKTIKTPASIEENVGEIFSKSERFIDAYKKHIIIVVSAVIFVVVAVIAARNYYFLPLEREAQAAIFPGENYLANQQWDLALNGNGMDYFGFIGVMEDYGRTKTAKLARLYTGICYYNLNDPGEALQYLKKYKTSDKVLTSVVNGLMGDCYVDSGNLHEGIRCFIKAASQADNQELSPVYLKKAAIAYENIMDYANAVKTYQTIKDKYPDSIEASEAE
jgi:tetratricopeptide (TPR) repeat protein